MSGYDPTFFTDRADGASQPMTYSSPLGVGTRTSVTPDGLKVGDEIRRDGLKYRVTHPPVVEEAYADGEPACYRVSVTLVKSGEKDNLLYEAGASVLVLRKGL